MSIKTFKINDTSNEVTIGSKAERYLLLNSRELVANYLRPGIKLPQGVRNNNTISIVQQYKLKGIGFGNWVTLEDRINYQTALMIAFYDLNKVLDFGTNLGFNGNLTVTFGDRGIPNSLAHYSPGTILININRYQRGDSDKIIRFISSGGVHSFAHEYGHFLDFFVGGSIERDNGIYSLSDGESTSKSRTGRKTPIRSLMDDVLEAIIWESAGKLTQYYKSLLLMIDEKNGFGIYWIRRTELFARAFEVYIQYELSEQGINNAFLTKLRYDSSVYIDHKILMKIVPKMRNMIKLIRKQMK